MYTSACLYILVSVCAKFASNSPCGVRCAVPHFGGSFQKQVHKESQGECAETNSCMAAACQGAFRSLHGRGVGQGGAVASLRLAPATTLRHSAARPQQAAADGTLTMEQPVQLEHSLQQSSAENCGTRVNMQICGLYRAERAPPAAVQCSACSDGGGTTWYHHCCAPCASLSLS